MFQSLRSWGRLVGWKSSQETDVDDRRVWVRFSCDVETTCIPTDSLDANPLSARVQNISRGGMNLLMKQRFDTGAIISVDLPSDSEQSTSTVLAYVVRVAEHSQDEWAIGCTFAEELNDQDLLMFGAKRVKASSADQRTWMRFSCEARASCQLIKGHAPEPFSARVINIAPNGVGLVVPQSVELGSLLSLELRGNTEPPLTIMASVVRITHHQGPEWILGCSFIRELREHELRGLL